MPACFCTLQDSQDRLDQSSGGIRAEFNGNTCARAVSFVHKVNIQRMLERRVERVLVGDIRLAQRKPTLCAFVFPTSELAVSSALEVLTSEFGMESGGSPPPWSPGRNI